MFDVTSLRGQVSGPVLLPDDPGFIEEVTGWLRNFSQHPDVVVGTASTADVIEAVRFATANRMPVRVQGTGHGADSAITDGMLITTRRLDELTIDADSRLATIGAGLAWSSVVDAAAPLGLAPISGSSTTVGVVGLLLGGGLGPLARSHGFASDYLREVELVTADGELIHANTTENADLFWALRGGKGGFGVVTRVSVELVRLETLYGGTLMFDAPQLADALHAWVTYLETADAAVSTSAAIMRFPALPFIPEPVRGRTVLTIRFAYPGDAATGEALAGPLRGAAPVYLDRLAEMSASQLESIHADPKDPSNGWVRGRMLAKIDHDLADTLLGFAGEGKEFPFVAPELRHLGAATTSDVPGGSAVSGRTAHGTLSLVGAPNPALFQTVIPRVASSVFDATAPWIDTYNNVNFAGAFASRAEFESAWPADTFARLDSVRVKYDPRGTFAYGVSS